MSSAIERATKGVLGTLVVPLAVLNAFGGIGAGIWLAALGKMSACDSKADIRRGSSKLLLLTLSGPATLFSTDALRRWLRMVSQRRFPVSNKRANIGSNERISVEFHATQ